MECFNIKFHHYGLFTSRPEKLLWFYREVMGFRIDSQVVIGEEVFYPIFGIKKSCNMARLAREDLWFEIFWLDDKKIIAGSKGIGYNHISFKVQNKEEFCLEVLKKAGSRGIKTTKHKNYTIRKSGLIKVIKVDRGQKFTPLEKVHPVRKKISNGVKGRSSLTGFTYFITDPDGNLIEIME